MLRKKGFFIIVILAHHVSMVQAMDSETIKTSLKIAGGASLLVAAGAGIEVACYQSKINGYHKRHIAQEKFMDALGRSKNVVKDSPDYSDLVEFVHRNDTEDMQEYSRHKVLRNRAACIEGLCTFAGVCGLYAADSLPNARINSVLSISAGLYAALVAVAIQAELSRTAEQFYDENVKIWQAIPEATKIEEATKIFKKAHYTKKINELKLNQLRDLRNYMGGLSLASLSAGIYCFSLK